MKTDELEVLKASEAAMASPHGLADLWRLKESLEAENRLDAVHACSDLIVGLSADHKTDLARAEQLARRLVDDLPDQRHFWLLSRILDAQGKADEARVARDMAAKADNKHPKPPDQVRKQLLAEAIAAQAAKTGLSD